MGNCMSLKVELLFIKNLKFKILIILRNHGTILTNQSSLPGLGFLKKKKMSVFLLKSWQLMN
jgi:hypothetical protein